MLKRSMYTLLLSSLFVVACSGSKKDSKAANDPKAADSQNVASLLCTCLQDFEVDVTAISDSDDFGDEIDLAEVDVYLGPACEAKINENQSTANADIDMVIADMQKQCPDQAAAVQQTVDAMKQADADQGGTAGETGGAAGETGGAAAAPAS